MMRVPSSRNLPLRTQLLLALGFLAITATAIPTIILVNLGHERLTGSLIERAQRIAGRLQRQLEDAEARQALPASRLFAAYSGDPELEGMALYSQNGMLI